MNVNLKNALNLNLYQMLLHFYLSGMAFTIIFFIIIFYNTLKVFSLHNLLVMFDVQLKSKGIELEYKTLAAFFTLIMLFCILLYPLWWSYFLTSDKNKA